MNALPARDRLGTRRIFHDPASGARAEDLRSLLTLVPSARLAGLDPVGIDAAWGLTDAPDRTCLAAVRAVPPGRGAGGTEGELSSSLVLATARALASSRHPIVALGGGVDAPLAVLAARASGIAIDHAIHLALPGTPYDESIAAQETAAALGLSLHAIVISLSDLAAELPRAVRHAETPLYNLHPVSRAIVARVARSRGHDALLTGDGADQAARGAVERADYVPVVAALTRAAGLALASPFVDDDVVELLAASSDPEKRALRAVASAWGLPSSIAERPKRSCWAPALPRAFFPGASVVASLSRALDRTLAWSDDDRANVGIASLASFVAAFEVATFVRRRSA